LFTSAASISSIQAYPLTSRSSDAMNDLVSHLRPGLMHLPHLRPHACSMP
jgi:hypothetical protein